MNSKVVIISIILIVILGGGLYLVAERTQPPIGGDTDAHGCLVAAGYAWCEARQQCERPWERYCTAAEPKTVTFSCTNEKSITATFYPSDDQYVDLVLSDERALSLPHATSASGARYAREDESIVFWNKGDSAFITENGTTTFESCTLNGSSTGASDYKDATYLIEGESITLRDGVAETQVTPDSAAKVVTRYFGNELKTDLNGDGREDVVFLLTQESGGSGTFFYVVAALNTEDGYKGSDGYFLGDRIAPQMTEESSVPRHKQVVVVNYVDRKPGEPMSTQPSVGKSVYLKLDPETMQWGIVLPDFEGESI